MVSSHEFKKCSYAIRDGTFMVTSHPLVQPRGKVLTKLQMAFFDSEHRIAARRGFTLLLKLTGELVLCEAHILP